MIRWSRYCLQLGVAFGISFAVFVALAQYNFLGLIACLRFQGNISSTISTGAVADTARTTEEGDSIISLLGISSQHRRIILQSSNRITGKESRMSNARLHLIVQFPVLESLALDKNNSVVNMRQKEFSYCLQRNLLSPYVQEVHILFEHYEEPRFIKAQNFSMDWKLVFHFLGRRMRYRDAFGYASNVLLQKNTIIMNADCYIDKGFELLDERILSNKTIYALTRHETQENVRYCNQKDFCGPESTYIGSHDAWLFRLLSPFSESFLSQVDYLPNVMGIEQVLIYNLRKHEGFTIRNPCKLLHIVHYHCSNLRNYKDRFIKGKRVDKLNHIKRDRFAPFSNL